MESPPSMPSRGLKVFFASFSPPGMEMVTVTGRLSPVCPFSGFSFSISYTVRMICLLGTGLMAGYPTGTCSPAFVAVPMPSPPARYTPGQAGSVYTGVTPASSGPASGHPPRTSAYTSTPFVISGSSPESFFTAQKALPSDLTPQSAIPSVRDVPSGVETVTAGTNKLPSFPSPDVSERRRKASAAAMAAAAAQVPVV